MAFCSRLKTSPLCVHCPSRDASRTFVMGETHDILPLEAVHQIQVSPVEPDHRLTRHICNVTTASKPNAAQRLFHELPFQEQTCCCLHRSFCLLCSRYQSVVEVWHPSAMAHVLMLMSHCQYLATWYAILTIDFSACRRLLLPLSLC